MFWDQKPSTQKEINMSANKILFQHYSEFPTNEWRWENFTPLEMACRGTGQLMVDFEAMDDLQELRDMLGEPIYINSAFRSEFHNRAVGGAPASQNLKANAFDCRMKNHDPRQFEAAARECGFTSFGYYQDQGFMHIDRRERPATWGTPWPYQTDDPAIDNAPISATAEPDQELGIVAQFAALAKRRRRRARR